VLRLGDAVSPAVRAFLDAQSYQPAVGYEAVAAVGAEGRLVTDPERLLVLAHHCWRRLRVGI
jgi:hypothetical protein